MKKHRMQDSHGVLLHAIAFAVVCMIIMQGLRICGIEMLQDIVTAGDFQRRMLNMCLMIVLTAALVGWSRLRRHDLNIFPETFTKKYLIATVVTAVLLVTTPSVWLEGLAAVWLLIYGSIVTPVFEELIFRGLIWGKMERCGVSIRGIILSNIILFTIWHLGYMYPQMMAGNWMAVITKLMAAAVYGAILSWVRHKTGNCYSTIMTHGIMNMFMV